VAPGRQGDHLDGQRILTDALHTWGGFSAAKWDSDVTVTVTHLKEVLRRNGLPRSDKATMTEH
jgi:hypothetical protein